MSYSTIITAHSGCDGTPDNSIDFIKTALSIGTEAFEIDVNRGNDGNLYLRHDTDPSGEYTGCPRLEQAFELMKPFSGIKINCDLKVKGLEIQVFELAKKVGVEDRLIYSGTVGFDFLEEHHEIAHKVEIFLNIEEIFHVTMYSLGQRLLNAPEEIPEVTKQAGLCCKKYNIGVLNVYFRLCTDEFIKTLDELGVRISAWTVNEEADIVRLLGKGVRNITTRKAKDAVSIRKNFYESV